jgi:hypothetical protein
MRRTGRHGGSPDAAMSFRLHRWVSLLFLVCWCVSFCWAQPSAPKQESTATAATSAQDSDGDGLSDEMEASLGTSPLLADTDGDGFSDYQEVVEYGFDPANDPYKFNPRIADVPQLDIEISSSPQVHFEYTTSEGKQDSIEMGTTTDNSWSTQNSYSHTVTLGVKTEAGFTGPAPTGSVSFSAEYSYQCGKTATREQRESLARVQTETASKEKTTQGGKIVVGVKLHNRGNVQLQVESLRLSALKVPVNSPDRPKLIGQLELDTKFTFGGITRINPHSATEELLFSTNLDLSQMEGLLGDGSLVIRVADATLAGAETFTDIGAKTATVVIDRGPGDERLGNTAETYLVAVHSSDGARGISASEVLRDVLHLEYQEGPSPWKYGAAESPEKLREGQTRSGLRSLLGSTNDYESNGYWIATHTSRVGSRTQTVNYTPFQEDYSLDDIRLYSGHTLELMYVQDADRDGLEYRTELMLGTDPRKKDTDGDGLTDGEEVAGWTVEGEGRATPRQVRSDPLQADSDGDGLSDSVEKELQTDPVRRNSRVPSVVKKDLSVAIRLLQEAGLGHTVTIRGEERTQPRPVSPEMPSAPGGPVPPAGTLQQGLVLEQSPRAGDLALEGAVVTLVVLPQVRVPAEEVYAITDVMVTDDPRAVRDGYFRPEEYTGVSWKEVTLPYLPGRTGRRVTGVDVNTGIGGTTTTIWVKYERLPQGSDRRVLVDIAVSHWVSWRYAAPDADFEAAGGHSSGIRGALTTKTKGSVWCNGLVVKYRPLKDTTSRVLGLYLSRTRSSEPSAPEIHRIEGTPVARVERAGVDVHTGGGGDYFYLMKYTTGR